MPKSKPRGMVFVSYAHADSARVEPLVKALAKRFNVWWDRDIEPGELWRRTLMDQLGAARCVVVVWTMKSVTRDIIWSEVQRAKERGVLVPVKFDRKASIPLGFDQLQHVDLAAWPKQAAQSLQPLFARIQRLLARPYRAPSNAPSLAAGAWAVRESQRAAGELMKLSGRIRTLGGILIPRAGPVVDLLGTLEEIHRTYASVSDAIGRFVAPAVGRGAIKPAPYLAFERGSLRTQIENNRGHCTRILEYYGRVDGLRDWLTPRLEPAKLTELDGVFGQLATADGDLFASLARIGDVMTEEASEIVGLLLAEQQDAARRRILTGRKKLLPLERKLSAAMTRLARIETSLGYVRGPQLLNSRG